MPTPTYVPLATITLTATDSEIVFSSIPATYRDLILVCGSVISSTGNPAVIAQVNNDTGAAYSFVRMRGDGSSPESAALSGETRFTLAASGITTSNPATILVHFMDYAATDKHKTILNRHNRADGQVEAFAQRYASTNAINSIKVFLTSASFGIGSSFSLYGIA